MWTKKIICYIQTFLLTVHFCCICVYFSACFYHEAQTLSPCVCVSVCLRVRVSVCACVLDNRKCCCLHTHNTQHTTQGGNTQYQHVFTATASRRGCGDPPPLSPSSATPQSLHCATVVPQYVPLHKMQSFHRFLYLFLFIFFFKLFHNIHIHTHVYICIYVLNLYADVAVTVAFESRIYHRVKACFPLPTCCYHPFWTLLSYLRDSSVSSLSSLFYVLESQTIV